MFWGHSLACIAQKLAKMFMHFCPACTGLAIIWVCYRLESSKRLKNFALLAIGLMKYSLMQQNVLIAVIKITKSKTIYTAVKKDTRL